MSGLKYGSQIDMKVPPTEQDHLVRMRDVLDLVASAVSTPVRVLETSNIAGTYSTSAKTLTQTTATEFIVDGITLSLNDRVLLTGQTDQTQNGVYTVTTLGVTSSTAGVLTRAADFDETSELTDGKRFPVSSGLTHAGETWRLTGAGLTLDSSNLIFVIDITKYTEIAQKVVTLVGDDTKIQYTVTHDFNTRNVTVELFDATTGETVIAKVTRTNVNNIVVDLGIPLGIGVNLVVIIRAVVSPV